MVDIIVLLFRVDFEQVLLFGSEGSLLRDCPFRENPFFELKGLPNWLEKIHGML